MFPRLPMRCVLPGRPRRRRVHDTPGRPPITPPSLTAAELYLFTSSSIRLPDYILIFCRYRSAQFLPKRCSGARERQAVLRCPDQGEGPGDLLAGFTSKVWHAWHSVPRRHGTLNKCRTHTAGKFLTKNSSPLLLSVSQVVHAWSAASQRGGGVWRGGAGRGQVTSSAAGALRAHSGLSFARHLNEDVPPVLPPVTTHSRVTTTNILRTRCFVYNGLGAALRLATGGA
ncbi:hypothetical protein E2C01_028523 [Portunus trituberculatus]|uniref:Uncharacterized protein n=1 Tax=Portunus trituberculatus TaxID=210409 RepID=A0A5B7EPP1_PORTR|nr:hypothetical protein [Portunus trituberculatus]